MKIANEYWRYGGIAAALVLLALKFSNKGNLLFDADIDYRNQSGLPRGMRNNNPGNIKFSSSNNWLGQVGSDGVFVIFSSYKWGIRAMMKLLQKYFSEGRNTVESIISKWAPSGSEGNTTSSYIFNVAGYLNVSPADLLGFDYNTAANLVIGMAAFENGIYDAVTPSQTKAVWQEFFGNVSGIGKLSDTSKIKSGGRIDQYWSKPEINYRLLGRKAGQEKYLLLPEEAVKKFNLHGIEFGNWMNENDRLNFMYNTLVSLSDIAKALNIPFEKMGLKQRLSLAFGARGNGGFAAAFYMSFPIGLINLTKTEGRGTFAHEYGHAIDEHLHIKKYGTSGFVSGGRSERTVPQYAGLSPKSIEYHFEKVLDILYFNENGTQTNYFKLVKKRGGYWMRRNEVWARTFDRYIEMKFDRKGIINKWAYGVGDKMNPPRQLVDKASYHIQKIIAQAFK